MAPAASHDAKDIKSENSKSLKALEEMMQKLTVSKAQDEINASAQAIATFINAGGLGDMIVNGLKLQRYPVLITGAVLVACIAVLIDWAAGLVEDAVRPRGL